MESVFKIYAKDRQGDRFRYEAEVDWAAAVFTGHFPGMPVVPGVCLLNLVKMCIKEETGVSYCLSAVNECKFLAPLTPSILKPLEVECELGLQDGDETAFSALLQVDGIKVMKLKARLKPC